MERFKELELQACIQSCRNFSEKFLSFRKIAMDHCHQFSKLLNFFLSLFTLFLKLHLFQELQNLQQRKLPDTTEDDELTEWKEEACHRLRWFHEEIHNLEVRTEEDPSIRQDQWRHQRESLGSYLASLNYRKYTASLWYQPGPDWLRRAYRICLKNIQYFKNDFFHLLQSESKEIKQAIEETRSKMLILESKAALKEQNYIECLEKINTEIENLKQE